MTLNCFTLFFGTPCIYKDNFLLKFFVRSFIKKEKERIFQLGFIATTSWVISRNRHQILRVKTDLKSKYSLR